MEITEKNVKIFAVKSSAFIDEVLVMADDVTEAIDKFNKYYENDCDVKYHSKIESVIPKIEETCLV